VGQILYHTTIASFCAWPVFNFLVRNFSENIISDAAVLALILVFGLAACLSILAQHLFKSDAAKYVLPLAFLSFFTFGIWLDLFEQGLGLERYTAVFALVTIFVQFILSVWVVLKVASTHSGSRIAAIGFLALFVPSLASAGVGLLKFTQKNIDVGETVTAPASGVMTFKPNIYFIILDMYARQDVLKTYFDIDNSAFLDALETRGFIVDRQSYSNYPTTPLSLSTTFNMDYYTYTKDYSVDLIRGQNPVVSFFKQQDYQFIFVDSGGNSQIACSGFEDICLGSGNIQDDIALLLKMTPLWRILKSGAFARYFEALYLLTDLEQSMREVSDTLKASKRPAFVFAHIISPHEPARFNNDCNLLFTINPGLGSATREQYRNDLPCLNAQVLRTVDNILENEKTTPIVLIQSDHGIRNVDFASDDVMLDLKNLMTFLIPESCKDLHHQGMTPVNNFRLVISCITANSFMPVEDKLFIWNGDNRDYFQQVDSSGNLIKAHRK